MEEDDDISPLDHMLNAFEHLFKAKQSSSSDRAAAPKKKKNCCTVKRKAGKVNIAFAGDNTGDKNGT